MSSEAKVWQDGQDWLSWKGRHDGPCTTSVPHDQGGSLSDVIGDIEACRGAKLRWEFRTYPDEQIGLVGYAS